ncbi:uncharacterized protein LOC119729580 [Patiria miniata]|uniref:CMP/dCMP-type deaminase domain-containing protein n=1 Tax=Patiria miniata TaxID=46514 RepID=A0A914A2R0_PATMI|nr:uncharacterized protein LOC119729580 [Patiria miniata]
MDDMISNIQKDIETFIWSCTYGDQWPNRTVLLVNEEVHYNISQSQHAEMNALPSIKKLLDANKEIVMYINYSPCSDCAENIAKVLKENPEVPVWIKFAFVYYAQYQANRDGLRTLMSGSNTTLETIHWNEWITVIQRILESHGKTYWKTILHQILDEHSASGQEEVLQEILKCHGADYWTAKSLQTSVIALDDEREKWEEDLKAILLENWEMEQKLREILKHHGEDQWPTVLAMIRKHQKKDGWQTTPAQLLQTTEVDAEILSPSERDCLRALSMEKPGDHRQGYVWLKVVLAALDIEVREEWLGQRIRTDTSAAKELKAIIHENS